MTGPTPNRSAGLDQTVLFHELTHAMDVRLHTGITNLGFYSQGLTEGWADFFSLAITMKHSDAFGDNYPMFAYAARHSNSNGCTQSQPHNFYYGARNYPYSVDLGVSPLTFGHLVPWTRRNNAPCGWKAIQSGVNRNPCVADPDDIVSPPPDPRIEKYFVAEVWVSMLLAAWHEMTGECGLTADDEMMMQLVLDGMKLDPSAPNVVQARDAILQADLIRYGGVHQRALWKGVASRGLGVNAYNPPNMLLVTAGGGDVCEDFSEPAPEAISVFFPDGIPAVASTCESTEFDVCVVAPGDAISEVVLNASPFGSALGLPSALDPTVPGIYHASLPPAACRQAWSIWVEVTLDSSPNTPVVFPDPAPSITGGVPEPLFYADMESATPSWTVDDPSIDPNPPPSTADRLGVWELVDPRGSMVEPSRDGSVGAGTMCWVTGHRTLVPGERTAVNAADVDVVWPGVVLSSPAIPVSGSNRRAAIVEFSLWYASHNGLATDEEVFIDWLRNGVSTFNLTLRPAQSKLRWQRIRFTADVDDDPNAVFRLRIRAVDPTDSRTPAVDSVVECGIDDVQVWIVQDCAECCDGDYDCNGVYDQDDVAQLIIIIAGGSNPCAVDPDFNKTGVADQDDIADLINYIGGSGCP